VPAAAVIPAPRVSMVNAAVKKSVVCAYFVYVGRVCGSLCWGFESWVNGSNDSGESMYDMSFCGCDQ